jgi:energy-coupling factor transporter ATP-binding protein EcfA2
LQSNAVLKWNAALKRIVLAGAQGVGKTTLFNMLTGECRKTSSGLDSCTRVRSIAPCQSPFQAVEIIDTPGMGTDEVGHTDSYELREAFIRKPVNQVVIVASLPNNSRIAELFTSLQPIDKIMSCNTFKMDVDGVLGRGRTKAFLVLTHRDAFARILPRHKWGGVVAKIRNLFPWVGSVAFTDPTVTPQWMLSTIVASALCESSRDYHIPMNEFILAFPVAQQLPGPCKLKLLSKRLEFAKGVKAILEFLQHGPRDRLDGEDLRGSTADVVFRFLEDSFEKKTLEAVAGNVLY